MTGRVIRPVLTLGLGSMLAFGCARQPNAALEQARASLRDAEASPGVDRKAAVALDEAQHAIGRGDTAWKKGDDDETEHQAYVAQQRVEIARAVATQQRAEKDAEALHGARGDIVANARTAEADELRAKNAKLEDQLRNLKPRETERGMELTLDDVLFEFDRADLKPGAQHDLDTLADFLRANPGRPVMIEGHTDAIGSASYNADLSERRAESVRSYLVRRGVPPERITARGYGKDYPIASNATESGRLQNRRVEIVVLREGMTPTARAH